MTATNEPMDKACQEFLDAFFVKHPDNDLRDRVGQALAMLLNRNTALRGAPSGWAAGIVYAVANRGQRACGVLGMLNADFERFFGVSMSTVRKRAAQVEQELDLDASLSIDDLAQREEFSLRDEANAICAYAFRNGPIEDIHADGRISDPEMKHLMTKASESLAKLLTRKQETPAEYDRFIRDYHRKYCRRWER